MDRSKATYEAFDGVELRLFNDRVVRCPALGVGEAIRYLRLLGSVSEDFQAHHTFMGEFPERIGIIEVPLRDLGFSMKAPDGEDGEELDGGELTVKAALGYLELLSNAGDGDPRAQADFMDRFPAALGFDPSSVIPSEIFAAGRTFAERVYELIYGLASDFSSHLTTSPRGQVTMTLQRAQTKRRVPTTGSMPASMT